MTVALTLVIATRLVHRPMLPARLCRGSPELSQGEGQLSGEVICPELEGAELESGSLCCPFQSVIQVMLQSMFETGLCHLAQCI